jgi:hypothetical protein
MWLFTKDYLFSIIIVISFISINLKYLIFPTIKEPFWSYERLAQTCKSIFYFRCIVWWKKWCKPSGKSCKCMNSLWKLNRSSNRHRKTRRNRLWLLDRHKIEKEINYCILRRYLSIQKYSWISRRRINL